VRVPVFSIGFGPPILRFQAWGTEWRVSLIPLGGYAVIEGMVTEPGSEPVGYAKLPFWGKALILLGGVFMNLLLAWLLLGYVFYQEGVPRVVETEAQIIEVLPGSLAERAGLKPGDVVVAIDGEPLRHYTDLSRIKEEPGEHVLTVRRGDEVITLKLVWDPAEERIGVRYGPRVEKVPVSYLEGVLYAVGFSLRLIPMMAKSFVVGIAGLFVGRPPAELVGPVGIVGLAGEAARRGLVALAELAATINLSLAVFNLLPIPGLDGGRLFLLVLQRLLGRRFSPEKEALINLVGIGFVLLLLLLITFQDLVRLLGGG